MKSLQQLIEPGVVQGKVTLPIVAVLDWPDLAFTDIAEALAPFGVKETRKKPR